jgi:hypothetical protein
MRALFVVLLLCVIAQAQVVPPYNTNLMVDTVWVKSTGSVFSQVFWQDAGANKAVSITMDDTSAAARANDSAAISVELKQVFATQTGSKRKYAYVMPSLAHPDSTTWPGGSGGYFLWDSLDVLDMDTLAVYHRERVPEVKLSDTVGWYYNRDIDSLVPAAERMPLSYRAFSADPSPGIAFKVTGKDSNKKSSFVRVIINYWQIRETK